MKISKSVLGLGLATLVGVAITSVSTIKAVKASKIIKQEREEMDKIIEEVHDADRPDIYPEEMYERDLMISENKALAKTIIAYSIPVIFSTITVYSGYKFVSGLLVEINLKEVLV